MPYRVAIGTSSFAELDKTPIEILKAAGIEVVPNPYKRRLNEREIISILNGMHGLIAGLEPLNRKVLESATSLKVIARVGIGMDNIDLEAAKELNIKVSNTPDGPSRAVAELCMTALLTLIRHFIIFNREMHREIWQKRIGLGLEGIKVLIIGYGRIGRCFANMLRYFNTEIFIVDPKFHQTDLTKGEKLVNLEEGLLNADVVSLHASGTEEIITEKEFSTMKKGIYLLNSARGELINETALINALNKGIVSAAWLDVYAREPYSGPLSRFDQVLLTPHVSTYTRQCRSRMETEAVQNLLRDIHI